MIDAPDPPSPSGPAPDPAEGTVATASRPDLRTIGIMGLFVLALLYTLYFARAFLIPITIALLLNFLLSPPVRWLRRRGIPNAIGAALIVFGFLGIVGAGGYRLATPAREWLAKGPASLEQARNKLRRLRVPVEQMTHAAEQVEQATSSTRGDHPAEVVVRGPSLGAQVFGATQSLLTAVLGIIILLYFLLAAGELFTLKLVRVLPQFADKRKAVSIVNETELSISRYLATITVLNVGQGLVVGLLMYFIGMPNPGLWGVLAGVAEFIPYVGSLSVLAILTVAGLVTFDHVGHAMLAPASYLVVNLLQSNVVSPLLLGHRLALNPVAVFIGLAFWLWVWGIPGAFIAVPLLATIKICCDHIEMLAPLGEFLGS